MARSREVRKLDQNRATSSTDSGDYGSFGGPHPQPAQCQPRPADTHRCTLPVRLLEPRSNLPRGIREYDAQGAIDNGNALVDGTAGQLAWLTGLESHIVEQCRFGEGIFGDGVGVMNTLPPTEKVQQLVRITFQGIICQAAKGLVIEILIDPVNLTSCRLHDDAIRASCLIVGGLVNHTKRHGRAASSSDWNWRASPPWTKKLFGSCPSGSETRQAFKPCSLSRPASDLGRLLAAAVAVGIKGEIDGSRAAVAQLPKLVCIEMVSHRTGDVVKTGLPQRGVVEQTLDENHFRRLPDWLPQVQPTLGPRQKPVRRRRC